ncbi:MAG: SDR family NAD(P)-dependent oxidoreductase [Desulfococcaceae bacterium]
MENPPVVIVTGASRGIGADIVRWLGTRGCSITLIARRQHLLHAVAEDAQRLGGMVLPISADIADRDVCLDIVRETVDLFGRVDALVNNAGILSPIVSLAAANPNAWTYNIEVNLFASFYMIQAAISELRKNSGRIINVSSGAAHNPVEGWGAYCVAKAGLTQLTRVLALEEREITAIAVRPGIVDTEMQDLIRSEGPNHMKPEKAGYFRNLWEEGKLVPPHIPARAIAWLALHAPAELSGEFADYNDPRIAEPALSLFGESISP